MFKSKRQSVNQWQGYLFSCPGQLLTQKIIYFHHLFIAPLFYSISTTSFSSVGSPVKIHATSSLPSLTQLFARNCCFNQDGAWIGGQTGSASDDIEDNTAWTWATCSIINVLIFLGSISASLALLISHWQNGTDKWANTVNESKNIDCIALIEIEVKDCWISKWRSAMGWIFLSLSYNTCF